MNNEFYYTKKTSKKYFYLFVGLLAVFVACISGTYAYFVAGASNSSISGSIANVGVQVSVAKLDNSTASKGTSLIPFNLVGSTSFNSSLLTTATTGAFARGCVDKNGYTSCQVYKIGIKSDSQYVLVNAYLKIGPSDTSPNLRWLLLNTNSVTNNLTAVTGLTSSIYTAARLDNSNVVSPVTNTVLSDASSNGTLFANATVTTTEAYWYVLVWLEDPEGSSAQEDTGDFSGVVTVTGVGGSGGKITADFSS